MTSGQQHERKQSKARWESEGVCERSRQALSRNPMEFWAEGRAGQKQSRHAPTNQCISKSSHLRSPPPTTNVRVSDEKAYHTHCLWVLILQITRYVTSLNFSFPTCEMGIMIPVSACLSGPLGNHAVADKKEVSMAMAWCVTLLGCVSRSGVQWQPVYPENWSHHQPWFPQPLP